MKLKTLFPILAMLTFSSAVLAAPVTYPGPVAVDDVGAVVFPTSISVASVTDLDGNAISTPGAVAHVAGPNTSAVYDAAAKGEAWITLTPVLSGHTFVNSPPRIFASTDPQSLATVNTTANTINTTTTSTNALATGINTQTAKIATNAMDSPNEITSQGNAGTILTQTTAANQQSNAIAGMTTQGYTTARAPKLDNLDALVSSRMATFTYTAPPTLPGDYLNAAEIAKLAFLDAAISSRSTYAGGAVASVTGAVTLPTTAPAGYGGSTSDTSGVTTLLAKIGTPAGASLAADLAAVKADTGNLVTGVAALPAAVWAYTAADGLTHQQSDALRTAILARGFAVSYNATTRTQVTTYFKADNTTALATTTVVYDLTGRAVTRTTAFTNLP